MGSTVTPAVAQEPDWKGMYLMSERKLERERKVRVSAEAIAEKGLRDLYVRERRQNLLQTVAAHANGTSSCLDALRHALVEICDNGSWTCGFAYLFDEARFHDMSTAAFWHADTPGVRPFVDRSMTGTLPRASSLPGRVATSGAPVWLEDISSDPVFVRGDAAATCGLNTAVAFPIKVRDEVVAVVEVFSRAKMGRDDDLMEVLSHVGTQVGRVFERDRVASRLVHEASHDVLTGLPNRHRLMELLDAAIARSRDSDGCRYDVTFIDLDRFKVINDSLGHGVGDAFLKGIADRFAAALAGIAGEHVLARLGGDEFVVLSRDGAGHGRAVGDALLASLDAPIEAHGNMLHASASIGVTSSGVGYLKAADVLRDADAAMYHAKGSGKGRVSAFDPSLHAAALERLRMENDLRRAVSDDLLRLHYQSIVDARTEEVVGYEALLRWERSPGVLTSPAQFVPIAEETGLIVQIGAWTLREACAAAARLNAGRDGGAALTMSVNASSRQFQSAGFADEVRSAMAAARLDPALLKVEVTESVTMADTDQVAEVLRCLGEMGVRIRMDDFGTGFSSLSNLQKLPFEVIKVDRSFVSDMSQGGSEKIVRTIIQLAHSLDMPVVAEGVEDRETYLRLRSMGCDYVQGYLFSRPAAEAELAWDTRSRTVAAA